MVARGDGGFDVEKRMSEEEITKAGAKMKGEGVAIGEILNCENISDSRDFSCVDLGQKESAEEQIVEDACMRVPAAGKAVESDGEVAKEESSVSEGEESASEKSNLVGVEFIHPHAQLPKPEAPRGITDSLEDGDDVRNFIRSASLADNLSVDVPAIRKFIRERSSSFSTALAKRLSSTFKENIVKSSKPSVTEFNLSGLKVIVKSKDDRDVENANEFSLQVKGRISFFSRSNCRDSKAVRTFFREKGLKFVEINIDVFPNREKELIQRTGSSSVPQIFFNEKLLGGLVVLNSLRNSGRFEGRMMEMLVRKCPDEAPAPPVYGFDDDDDVEDAQTDEMIGIVRILRQRLPIQDRFIKMKIVTNCFAGSELVEVTIHHMNCGRKKAVEVGKVLARKHFIHHVFGGNEFEDGNNFYRFLEHEPCIPRCYNFCGSNDDEPKPASIVGQRLAKLMSAILESYASEDRRHVDYISISNSEEFRRYINLVQDLHRVDIQSLSTDEKLAFFLNLYNAMVIHAIIRIGHPGGLIDRRLFFSDFLYLVGGHSFSLSEIENGILRNNRKPPYSLIRLFSSGDWRLQLALPKVNPLIHFGLCNGTKSSPIVRFFSAQTVQSEIRAAAREFFQYNGIEIDLVKRTVHLSPIINWFKVDFGSDKEVLKWILSFVDASKAGLLTHLLNDGESVRISYEKYDWSPNM